MIKIGFWDNNLCERGTSLALYNYAYYNEEILNNKSFVFHEKYNKENNTEILKKFNKRFDVFSVEKFNDVIPIVKKLDITHFFVIKSGELDEKIVPNIKNCIQCVFNCGSPHGDVYCAINKCLKHYKENFPIIPRIITLPQNSENMRATLKIPQDAVVFGGYGGKDSFSINFVKKVVEEIANMNTNIYFIFANFHPFCNKSNVKFISQIIDLDEKVKFINTTDAMLWARKHGETFGQAIAEFSIKNKPIIAMKIGDLAHWNMLGTKGGIWYDSENSLKEILLNFKPNTTKDWNCYKEFSPEKVMKIFDDVFLQHT